MLRKLFSLALMGLVAIGVYCFMVTRDLPSIEKVLKDGINPTQWTQVFAADGTPILSYGKFHHQDVELEDVSEYFTDSLLATEDRRFYQHKGVDPVAVARAVVQDVIHRQVREGGSTLTQQLARNVFLSSERSFSRKIREAALSMQLEQKLSKDQILSLYINNIYFGEGAYGIKAASEIYFNKQPSRLTVDEAALLAGLPQAPSGYSPFHNKEMAVKRRNEVLANLYEVGKITKDELTEYQNKPLRINQGGQEMATSDKAPYFNHYIMEQVQRYFDLDEQTFWQSGLKIYTTLDLQAQRLAQQAVRTRSAAFGRTGLNQQAALLSINPQTGAILAYVGGKDYSRSQFDRVTQAARSPGSLFKIFTYTAAIDKGYEPTRVYRDEPIKIGDWQPRNYDRSYHGYMTLARALITSNNIVAVKVMSELGPEAVIQIAHQMGVKSRLEPSLGTTLGGSSVNLMEMTNAFGVLANQGVRVEPYGINKITDPAGRVVYRQNPVKMDVLNRTTVDTMVRIMQSVIDRGTGRAASIGRPVAGKTGTSDDYRDAWFIGFTPDVVTGVWVGNDNNSPMPNMTGGSLPAIIWKAYMGAYLNGKPTRNFDLAYAKGLNEADYTTYNINNLSDRENNNPLSALDEEDAALGHDGQLDTGENANAGAMPVTDENGLRPLVPPTGNDGGNLEPLQQPVYPANPANQPPPGGPQPRMTPVAPPPPQGNRGPGTPLAPPPAGGPRNPQPALIPIQPPPRPDAQGQ